MSRLRNKFDHNRRISCTVCNSDLIWSESGETFVARGGPFDGASVCHDGDGEYWGHDVHQDPVSI